MIEAFLGPYGTVAALDIQHKIVPHINETNYPEILEHLYQAGFTLERAITLIEKLKSSDKKELDLSVDLYKTAKENTANRERKRDGDESIWQFDVNHAIDLVIGNKPTRTRLLFEAVAATSEKIAIVYGEGGVKNNIWYLADEIGKQSIVMIEGEDNRQGRAVVEMSEIVKSIDATKKYGGLVVLSCNPSQQKLIPQNNPVFYCLGTVGKQEHVRYDRVVGYPLMKS